MEKLFYPAIFELEEDGGYSIYFPDVEGCFTQGDNMEDGYKMANDALGLSLSYIEENRLQLPKPSTPDQIETQDHQFIVVIEFDMLEYRRKNDSKAVKKTLTIPSWLNELAVSQNINFSQVLQEALLSKVKM